MGRASAARRLDSRARRVARALFDSPGEEKTLEQLCAECGASKRTVQRLFLEETGISFNRSRSCS